MSQAAGQIEADIAYLRQVAEGDGNLRPLARGYLTASSIYGAQFLLNWLWTAGIAPGPQALVVTAMNVTPTGLLLALIVGAVVRKQHAAGMVGRAVDTIFNAALLAQMMAVGIMGLYAWRTSDFDVMYLALAVAFAFQGAAWTAGSTLRKRAWMGVVATGWFATGLVMALLIGNPIFHLATAFGFFAWGALPALVLLRQGKPA